MRRNESTELSPFAINPQMFGGRLRACNANFYCQQASKETKELIGHGPVRLSMTEVKKQAHEFTPGNLPQDAPNHPAQAYYRQLLQDKALSIKSGHARRSPAKTA